MIRHLLCMAVMTAVDGVVRNDAGSLAGAALDMASAAQ